MTLRPKKPAPKIIHICSKEEQITKMNLLLLGNGNPKDGYIFKVMEMTDQIGHINEKLTGISAVVKELHESSIGERAVVKGDQKKWRLVVEIIGIVIAAIMMWQGFEALMRVTKDTNSRVQTTNDAVIGSQKRGSYYDPFASDTIKDTIK